MKTIYLDYAATTPVDPEVATLMSDCLTLDGNFANPASRSHRFGWQAEQAVEVGRRQLAELIHADPRELVWTSGATESNNLALKGVVEEWQHRHSETSVTESKVHLITSSIEHKAILDVADWLQGDLEVTYLKPDAQGLIHCQQVLDALQDNTLLVSLMAVNNELGTITQVQEIGAALAEHSALFHVDAAQALGKMVVDVKDWQVDLMSLSAHKCYGPKGIGALYVRRQPLVKLKAQMLGGGHERGMRSGTLPTHQIAGFGKAAALVSEQFEADEVRIRALRDRFEAAMLGLGDVYLNGHLEQRVANHCNLSFGGVDGEVLLASLPQLAMSSGSACTSASIEPSYVLKAIGRSDELAHAGLRFSFGRFTSEEDVDFAIEQMTRVVQALRR